jgi:hypothetical protein
VNVVQSLPEPSKPDRTPDPKAAAAAVSPSPGTNGNGKYEVKGMPMNAAFNSTEIVNERPATLPDASLINGGFPFELTNHVEEKARVSRQFADDHELMIDVAGELLKTIDGALGRAGLDFTAAFEQACSDVAGEYPFLAPERNIFRYSSGTVHVDRAADLHQFSEGLGNALARIFDRLSGSPKFGKVFRFTAQRVRLLIQKRKDQFDRLLLTTHIESALGV